MLHVAERVERAVERAVVRSPGRPVEAAATFDLRISARIAQTERVTVCGRMRVCACVRV